MAELTGGSQEVRAGAGEVRQVATGIGLADSGYVTECIFYPLGELDLATADATLNAWLTIVDRDRPRRVTVDLSQVTFVDSSGMRVLYLLHRRIIRQGGTCELRGASVHQQKLLRIADLAGVFPHADRPLHESGDSDPDVRSQRGDDEPDSDSTLGVVLRPSGADQVVAGPHRLSNP